MVKLIKKKVKASTLVEVVIALVIIMVVFTLAMLIFGNVLSSGVSLRKIQVHNQLNVLALEVKEKGYVAQAHIQLDSIEYTLITDTSGREGVSRLEIKAVRQGKLLVDLKCLFKAKEGYAED